MLEGYLNRQVQYWRFMSVYEVSHAMIVIEGCISLSWCFAAFYSQSTICKCLFIIATRTGCKLLHVYAKVNVPVHGET